jgi:hypothetical protein
MDPVSMILAFALKNPQATEKAISSYNTPGQVNTAQLQKSAADFAMEALTCYHRTARFRGVQVLGAPWREQGKFGADNSVVLRINLAGVSGTGYQMTIAAMAQGNSYRTFVLNENTIIPYNKNCQLERWTEVAQAIQTTSEETEYKTEAQCSNSFECSDGKFCRAHACVSVGTIPKTFPALESAKRKESCVGDEHCLPGLICSPQHGICENQ